MLTSSASKSPAILSTKARLILPVFTAAKEAGTLGDAMLATFDVGPGTFTIPPWSTEAAKEMQRRENRLQPLDVKLRDQSGQVLYDGRRADSICPWQWAWGRPSDREQCRA